MSARHQHKEVKKILCPECKTTNTTRIKVKDRGLVTVVAHRSICKSNEIRYCMQDLVGDNWSYHISKCGRPVKGHFKGGWNYHSGVPGCGLHLSVERRQREKSEARRSKEEIAAYLRDAMGEKIKLIEQLTGLVAQIHYRREYYTEAMHIDTEYILVRADDLIAAIEVEVEVE